MSKKKIIAGIMGSLTLITGDGSVTTLASISETEEENRKIKSEYWKQKKGEIKEII
ncbi:hypothetical protein [Spiroplasma endosymbiont of Colias croceus]|uniref:hypothetical protein n=1 Tax=Spiroplasma endosymbiont of Colias croceus TaxID=3066310 RepID=UPI0030D099CF